MTIGPSANQPNAISAGQLMRLKRLQFEIAASAFLARKIIQEFRA
jgi:hypothetical protein